MTKPTRYVSDAETLRAALRREWSGDHTVVTMHFGNDNPLPIWHDGDVIAHQSGPIAVAEVFDSDGVSFGFVGLLDTGELSAIAEFRVAAAKGGA